MVDLQRCLAEARAAAEEAGELLQRGLARGAGLVAGRGGGVGHRSPCAATLTRCDGGVWLFSTA